MRRTRSTASYHNLRDYEPAILLGVLLGLHARMRAVLNGLWCQVTFNAVTHRTVEQGDDTGMVI